jgi:hypothetical protein
VGERGCGAGAREKIERVCMHFRGVAFPRACLSQAGKGGGGGAGGGGSQGLMQLTSAGTNQPTNQASPRPLTAPPTVVPRRRSPRPASRSHTRCLRPGTPGAGSGGTSTSRRPPPGAPGRRRRRRRCLGAPRRDGRVLSRCRGVLGPHRAPWASSTSSSLAWICSAICSWISGEFTMGLSLLPGNRERLVGRRLEHSIRAAGSVQCELLRRALLRAHQL